MSESANVRSLDAIRQFASGVMAFQEEARLTVSALEMQLQRILGWLERDRPAFWKREIEVCYRNVSEARVRLHQCQMRRHGDFKPTCFEEKKDLERAKRELDFAQKQVGVVKRWKTAATHEADEYHGRAAQLTQVLERDIPRLLALLQHAIDRLEAYSGTSGAGSRAAKPNSGSPTDPAKPEVDPESQTGTDSEDENS